MTPFTPYVASRHTGAGPGRWLVAAELSVGHVLIGRHVHMPGLTVAIRDRVLPPGELTNYEVVNEKEITLQSFIAALKNAALEHGATPYAIHWLGELSPFTKKEIDTMAEKLKTKAAPAAAAKPAAKAKGNPEALAKARAEALAKARAAKEPTGPDNRKITVVKKPHGAREGTKRAIMLDAIYAAKTVQAVIDAGAATKSDVSWAAREGYISLA